MITELFRNPPMDKRGTPFWAWNDRLDPHRLVRQIEWFRQMGMGGFFMHPRTGLDTEYLGPEFMNAVAACADKADALGMHAWLYDEDRWPSGYAGGLITQDPACRERYLLFTPRPYGPTPPEERQPREWPLARNERGRLLARYHVTLADGVLADYRRLRDDEPVPTGGAVWYAYLEIQVPCAGWNHATLGDVLNPEVTRRFIAVTHERYAARVGGHFGKAVPGIFTDEPHFVCKQSLKQAVDQTDLILPFTDDLPESYRRAYGEELLDRFPEVVWDLPAGTASLARYRFHTHLCDRLVDGFLKPIHAWCAARGLAFTGHFAEETTLESQTLMIGDLMRGYPQLDSPGMDLLFDGMELNSAKQCQSAVRQTGRKAMASELYGATGWDFSFADFKAQGDWQAALGVTLRVHHLAWVSMEGEAKRDYPGPIFYQQPWWREFALIEDHFARINTLMTRGRPLVNVGVLHPIESFWLCFGPHDQTRTERVVRERHFKELTEWLLYGLIDFDFINESLLSELSPTAAAAGPTFQVGEMAYETVLVPGMRTIRSGTLDRLERFADAGGRLVFLGEIPTLVDVMPSARPAQLARRCACLPMERAAVLDAIAPGRLFDVQTPPGQPAALLHQQRQEGDRRYLFVSNTDRAHERAGLRFRFPGRWAVTRWDTLTGDPLPLPVKVEDGQTWLEWTFPPHGHLLISLAPAPVGEKAPIQVVPPGAREVTRVDFPERVPVTLSEPNVLPLDLARWRWEDESWQPLEETLRIEDALRRRFELPLRRSHNGQPWCEREPSPCLGRLALEFELDCACRVEAPLLAIEKPDRWRLSLDDSPVASAESGWWVDEAIRTVPLPALERGRHCLRMEIAFDRRTALEWSYLLGDFGVVAEGAGLRITSPVTELAWGDWTGQGLPFYTGNVTYRLFVDAAGPGAARLRGLAFDNPLLRVAVDGRDAGPVAFAPYDCELGELAAGRHELCLTAFGTRSNAFGPLHALRPGNRNQDPGAWHTTGGQWTAVRQVRPKGILQNPVLEL
jgi:hypothetical protein